MVIYVTFNGSTAGNLRANLFPVLESKHGELKQQKNRNTYIAKDKTVVKFYTIYQEFSHGPFNLTKKRLDYLSKTLIPTAYREPIRPQKNSATTEFISKKTKPRIIPPEQTAKNWIGFENKIIKELKKEKEKIIFVVGPNHSEELGFLYTINKLKEKNNLYLINHKKIKCQTNKNFKPYFAKSIGECGFEKKLKKILTSEKKLTKKEINDFSSIYKKLDTSKLKIRKSSFNYSLEKEDYYDKEILSYLIKDYRKGMKIIGGVIYEKNNRNKDCPDLNFLMYRINELIKNKKIRSKGCFEKRNLEIKQR